MYLASSVNQAVPERNSYKLPWVPKFAVACVAGTDKEGRIYQTSFYAHHEITSYIKIVSTSIYGFAVTL